MGVPKFFRWLSERYPKINQRQTCLPEEETHQRYFPGELPLSPLDAPDPLSTCGLKPEIDRLYIDCNGVIHGCSHNNGDATGVTNKDIFRNIAYYLDRAISDMVQPTELVYIAIDGVAPRAKLNQQRARRYRGGSEEMEQSIYEAFYEEKENAKVAGDRLTGKFESNDEEEELGDDVFHSNTITPGTEFFTECTQHLEHWIQYKLSTDPKWKNLKIVFSGPNTPGEGEHKIMEFMRQERAKPDYNPNLRHAIMGQDADLVMLGLVTHEPNLCVFRERVVFDSQKRALLADMGLDVYLHNCHFEWLHMSVLRDYLMYEFETAPAVLDSEFDRERTIDDFVFLTFFVGNDFLPHMPALDIGDEAFDLIFHVYKRERRKWLKQGRGANPYLTDKGNLVHGHRLENFLQALGAHETDYYITKREGEGASRERMRKMDAKMGFESSIPSDEILTSKEDSDRAQYREMMESLDPLNAPPSGGKNFTPVLTDSVLPTTTAVASANTFQPEEEDLEDGFLSRMGSLLQSSIGQNDAKEDEEKTSMSYALVDDQDLKGRYYYDKFRFSPFDAPKHRALRKAYMEGLIWNLKYYYQGCASWSWYYPFHYGPMLSDLVGLKELMSEIDFGEHNYGKPLKPFEQLMGCMPPSSSGLLPEPYRWLMTDQHSPVSEFYPRSFTVDMNGKRWPWEAVVLLPFLDARRLVEVATEHVKPHMLSEAEHARNALKETIVYYHDPSKATIEPSLPFAGNDDYYGEFSNSAATKVLEIFKAKSVFEPKLLDGVETPSPGFPSLTSAPIQSLWRRRIGNNVFGMRSRYRTAVLDTSNRLPSMPSIEVLASTLIGTTVHINYPYLMEGYVTALSNNSVTIRGHEAPHYHDQGEMEVWRHTMSALAKKLEYGEGVTGTGGWRLPTSSVAITVRPLKGLRTLPDGTQAKTYAKFEVTYPLMAAIWSPLTNDPRTQNLMAALEKDPFFLEKAGKGSGGNTQILKLLPPASKNVATTVPSVGGLLDSEAAAAMLASLGESSANSSTMLPPMDSASEPAQKSSLLPPMDGKRGFSTSPLLRSTHHLGLPQRRSLTTVARPSLSVSTIARGSSVRGRAMGLGVAALVFFGGAIGGTHANPNSLQTHGIALATEVGESVAAPPLEFEHGTTTLSFVFQDGIIAAVDSRASLGNFVGSKTVQKVLPINSHMLGTMAGGAADCSFWIRKLKAEAELFELSNGYRMSVARASRLISNVLYENRGADLSVGTMIMGFDPDGGPRIYYVDNTGARIEGDMFSVGSGSTFALGILDKERRFDMTQEEAIALGIKAIRHATFRDAYSGGFINVFVITNEGWKKVFTEDLASSSANMEQEKLKAIVR